MQQGEWLTFKVCRKIIFEGEVPFTNDVPTSYIALWRSYEVCAGIVVRYPIDGKPWC